MSTPPDTKRALAILKARLGPAYYSLLPHEREELVRNLLRK